jgi:DHA1 family bicyclomycin/chloramphenicol resistance-like MFS transporter
MSPREVLTFISAVMALTALAIDLMLPAFSDIREAFDLGADSNETAQIITVFFFGLAAAHLVYGPLADRFGRKPVLYLGIGIYIAGAVGSALAPSFGVLLISRFVWGTGAAGSRVVATAIIRDRFEGVAMAKAMSQVMAVFLLVPVFAPSVGALIILVLPWRGVFWFCVVSAVAIALWSLRMRETLAAEDRREITASATLAGYLEVARTPVTFGYTMSSVFLQGIMTVYLATIDLITSEFFDRESQFPVIFGSVGVLFGIAAIVNGRIIERLGIDAVVNRVFIVQLVLLPVLVFVTLSSGGRPEFWLFMPTIGVLLGSLVFLMPNLNSAAMEPVGHIAGTAAALTGAVRIASGAAIGGLLASTVDDSLSWLVVGIAGMFLGTALAVGLVRRGLRYRSL